MDNFEKKYNEALERARKIYSMIVNNEIIGFSEQIIEIFPVLRESRGERIRKKIIEHLEMIKNGSVICAIDTSEEIAWLEKQEQKPYGQRDECKDCQANYAGSCKGTCEMRQKEQKHAPDDLQKSFEAGQASIVDNPEQYGLCEKPAWSEEDETRRNNILSVLSCFVGTAECESNPSLSTSYPLYQREIDWLKSLSPQPHWRPSEQEKGALRTAIHILTEERNFPKSASHLQAILDAFDGKQSRKDWKPSEEQISSLKQARDYYMSGRIRYVGRHLSEIAEQLEKLM